jgi:hypothetical protein
LKQLLATEAKMQGEDAYYRHLVVRLVAGLVLLYPARIICKGEVTMEEILFRIKHQRRFLDSELLNLQGLLWDFLCKAE